jgi:hypothetical protein
MAETDRTKIARAQILSTTSQNVDNDLRWTVGERRRVIYFFFFMHNAFDI